MPKHNHTHKDNSSHAEHKTHDKNSKKHRVMVRAKDTPGIICIERNIHDEAIVISGTLTLEYGAVDINSWIVEELEKAAHDVKEGNGIIGHIKTAVTVTSTDMISVTDEKAMVTELPRKRARIALAAIVFHIEPMEAENIIRKALAGVRTRSRQEIGEDLK